MSALMRTSVYFIDDDLPVDVRPGKVDDNNLHIDIGGPTGGLTLLTDKATARTLQAKLGKAVGAERCCPLGCNGGACETCPCCCAGWCVTGSGGLPDLSEPEGPEDVAIWFRYAAAHNPVAAAWQNEHVELIALRAAVKRVRNVCATDWEAPTGPRLVEVDDVLRALDSGEPS